MISDSDRSEVVSHEPARRVLMSPELMAQWATRDEAGNRLSWEWHELRAPGLYAGCWEPTVTRHYDDNLLAAYKAEIAERVRALPVLVSEKPSGTAGIARHTAAVDRADVLRLIEDPAPSEGGEGR